MSVARLQTSNWTNQASQCYLLFTTFVSVQCLVLPQLGLAQLDSAKYGSSKKGWAKLSHSQLSWLELAKLWLSHGSCKKGNAPYMVLTDGFELAQTWTLRPDCWWLSHCGFWHCGFWCTLIAPPLLTLCVLLTIGWCQWVWLAVCCSLRLHTT